MSGLSQEQFEGIAKEVLEAWNRAQSRDAGFKVIVEYGQKYGYKNVIAAIQGRTPKRFTREKPVAEWVAEQREADGQA